MLQKLLIFSLFTSGLMIRAAAFQNQNHRVHLIELYSSEGCSSCPPAEEWLSGLRQDPGLWKNYVPIEFHVDYWNRLGWNDPYSKEAFTGRQRIYATEWKSQNVYTPGFVLNGEEWKTGFLEERRPPKQDETSPGIISVREISPRVYEVNFQAKTSVGQWTATGALLGNGLVSKITNGENQGKTLKHEFVALIIKSKSMTKIKDGYRTTLELDSLLKTEPKSLSLAVWISNSKSQRPIQALGFDLPQALSK